MKYLVSILSLMVAMVAPAQDLPHTLAGMRGHYRPLLVFTGGNARLAEQQLTIASEHAAEFREREILVVGVEGEKGDVQNVLLSPAEDVSVRKRLHVVPGEFTVILLGKDGAEKLRSHQPISFNTLRETIDAMPMRQREMKKQ